MITTLSAIGGLVVGFIIGCVLMIVPSSSYHSKRECRECMKRIEDMGYFKK